MRSILLVVLAGVIGCSRQPPPPAPVVPPDWVELSDVRMEGDVRDTVMELADPVFSVHAPYRPVLLVYSYPQVERLTLPADDIARDVAFFDAGGRALDVYSSVACSRAAKCAPITSKFAAMSVMVAPSGTFERFKLTRHGQMRWGRSYPPPRPIVHGLDG